MPPPQCVDNVYMCVCVSMCAWACVYGVKQLHLCYVVIVFSPEFLCVDLAAQPLFTISVSASKKNSKVGPCDGI